MGADGKIYNKFHVRRVDGSTRKGKKHELCDFFVLDITHDPYAKPALLAYADACETTHPMLAADIRKKINK